ncbi:hypothetical protein FQR65_LT17483 [Abscondita terminalis]|nr:hypothetical protein FQR65_LT17483 [Abscondita terminalis]
MSCVIRYIRNYSSSDSDSNSDNEWKACIKTRKKRVRRPYIEDYASKVVARYRDHEFKSHFRINRTTFDHLLGLIHNMLIRTVKGCETIPANQQLMISLWKMATPDSYISICVRVNVEKATVLRSVQRVTNALFTSIQLCQQRYKQVQKVASSIINVT